MNRTSKTAVALLFAFFASRPAARAQAPTIATPAPAPSLNEHQQYVESVVHPFEGRYRLNQSGACNVAGRKITPATPLVLQVRDEAVGEIVEMDSVEPLSLAQRPYSFLVVALDEEGDGVETVDLFPRRIPLYPKLFVMFSRSHMTVTEDGKPGIAPHYRMASAAKLARNKIVAETLEASIEAEGNVRKIESTLTLKLENERRTLVLESSCSDKITVRCKFSLQK